MYATCHTAGCGNADIPIDVGDLTWTDEEGNEHTSSVTCGVCSQTITDVDDGSEPEPEPPDRPDNTLPDPPDRPDNTLPETPETKTGETNDEDQSNQPRS